MAPEQEARERAFYDHESDEPRRRRRPAADWGVGEDLFDRMPSRRFKRADRRAEHRDEIVIRRGEAEGERAPRPAAQSWDDAAQVENERPPRGAADTRAPRFAAESWDDAALAENERPPRRAAESRSDAALAENERPPRRAAESWSDAAWAEPEDRPLKRGESRTIVIARDTSEFAAPEPEPEPESPPARKTVVISGHPDRLPAPQSRRPPRTAVERIGASPDRIAGYAVALGFLLVLIAVLTTGQ